MRDDRLYFAYGSNLNVSQMHERCPTAMAVRRFAINNWKLVFRDVADVEPCQGASVQGALYRVTEADIAALDRYEGVGKGLYRQVNFRITGTDELAFFYRMNDDYVYPPSQDYYETITKGYQNWQIPTHRLDVALHEAWADQKMLLGYSILLREYVAATEVDYGDCGEFQITCPPELISA